MVVLSVSCVVLKLFVVVLSRVSPCLLSCALDLTWPSASSRMSLFWQCSEHVQWGHDIYSDNHVFCMHAHCVQSGQTDTQIDKLLLNEQMWGLLTFAPNYTRGNISQKMVL